MTFAVLIWLSISSPLFFTHHPASLLSFQRHSTLHPHTFLLGEKRTTPYTIRTYPPLWPFFDSFQRLSIPNFCQFTLTPNDHHHRTQTRERPFSTHLPHRTSTHFWRPGSLRQMPWPISTPFYKNHRRYRLPPFQLWVLGKNTPPQTPPLSTPPLFLAAPPRFTKLNVANQPNAPLDLGPIPLNNGTTHGTTHSDSFQVPIRCTIRCSNTLN